MTCQNSCVDENTKLALIKLTKTLLDQNYFRSENTTYLQPEGLAMGAPTSSVFSEFYLQHLENHKIYNLLLSHKVEGYFRYVDDILIVYNEDNTNIDILLDHFNNLTPKLKFTIEKENNRQINFMDVAISRETNKLGINIYRKPTYTDTIIPRDSCHPKEQKMATIRYFYNRLNQYQLSPENTEKENNIILQILHNNGYDASTTKKIYKKTKNIEKEEKKGRWVKFTYVSKETRAISKVFKNTNVNVTFSVNNTIDKLLTTGRCHAKQKYDNCGIYQLTYPTSNKKYIGQSGSPFKTRFQEHFRDFKYRNNKSGFAQHLL